VVQNSKLAPVSIPFNYFLQIGKFCRKSLKNCAIARLSGGPRAGVPVPWKGVLRRTKSPLANAAMQQIVAPHNVSER
jgi:hypothetical protein